MKTQESWSAGEQREDLARAAGWLREARRVVALTGAGISVESGIPAFRGSQGLWDRYDPNDYAHIDSFLADPGRVWRMLKELGDICRQAKPNPAHLALAELERRGRLETVITQNVDGLHQAAGSRRVIEFHGSGRTLSCVVCRRGFAREDVGLESLPPRCDCGGALKPDVVLFGEPIPETALEAAVSAARDCQLMLVVGTSAVVAPASFMPHLARESGARIVEVNLEPTGLTNQVAHLSLFGPAGQVMPTLLTATLSGGG